ncbi:MAG TPA: TIGR02391 family protein [Phycisphaerae bacterium]|nr:TIGR02391 family protein [Phycisphaerae bacterium]
MSDSPFEMRFDPRTIKHLGVRMYSTLPPAIAEIIANSYDADASQVVVTLREEDGKPAEITVTDDGEGLTLDEINSKFLVIGRSRRDDDGDEPSPKYGRKRIGKKGLGKLALFGLAKTITITTRRDGKCNVFVLDWDDLNNATGVYKPTATKIDQSTKEPNGTSVSLAGLKRKTPFDAHALADSLSRQFIVDDNFALLIEASDGDRIRIDKNRRYETLKIEFKWDVSATQFVPRNSKYFGKLSGMLITAETPITPASGLRGITLFSRQKLVNAPEFFSSSTSSHFYQYLTGWIGVDFIDDLDDDVISTNRQSLDWEHPEMAKLRTFLAGIVSQVNVDWRRRRKEKKQEELKETTGIDTQAWMNTMPDDVRDSTRQIIESLGGEDALEKYTPVIKALHDLIPEYPLLHWRHLHEKVRDRVKSYYENKQFGDAASQGVQIYCEIIRKLTKREDDGMKLVNVVFGSNKNFDPPPPLQLNTLRTESEQCIQEGQGHLSRGIITGFRNPISHAPIDSNVPAVFSEVDCLNILSLVSYLVTRLDNAKVNSPGP